MAPARARLLLIDLTCLSVPSTGTRGMGRYAIDLARGLAARRDHEFAVRIVERLDWTADAVITDDVDGAVARLRNGTRPPLTVKAWAYRVRLRLAAAARQAEAAIVHSPDPNATPVVPMPCQRVVTCHDLINLAFPRQYLSWKDGWTAGRRRREARRYRRADRVIAVSGTTADDLMNMLGVPASRIAVVHNGVDGGRFAPGVVRDDLAIRGQYGLAATPYLLYLGGADWRKNPEGMLAALARLAQRQGPQAPALAWIGRLDPYDLSRLRRKAAAAGVVERAPGEPAEGGTLRLLGFVPDDHLGALLRGAVAMLFVSRSEGFGYPLVEAMAAGCPVIAADRPATREIGGDAVLAVDPDRADLIADAAERLMRDRDMQRQLAARGLERCRLFTMEQMIDRTLEVYRGVVRH